MSTNGTEAILIIFVILLGAASARVGIINEIQYAYADSNIAGIAYASSVLSSSVKYKEWIPSNETWNSEVALQDTGSQIVDAKILFSPNSSLRAILSVSANGDLNLFTCSSSCTDPASWTHVDGSSIANVGLLSLLALNPKHPYDMAFEQASGNLVITYDKGIKLSNSFFYRVFSSGSETLGAESSYQYAGGLLAHPVNYLRMASKVGSEEITMIFYDPIAFTSYAVIWDSASQTWGNQITVSSSLSAVNIIGESVGAAYETDSGASVVFSADGFDRAAYARWTGSGWSSVSTTDPEQAALLSEVIFVSVKPDPSPGSNKIMICQAGFSLTCAQLDSGVLGGWNDPGPQPVSVLSRAFDFAWDPTGSSGVLLSEAGLADDYESAIWTGSSWTAGSTISASVSHLWIQGATNPFDNDSVNSIFIGSNVLSELDYLVYDGSSLALSSGGLSVTQLGSALYEGSGIHFGQDVSSIPQVLAATIDESVLLSDNVSRQVSKQDLLSDLISILDDVLGVFGTGSTSSESIAIADSIAVVKTPGGGGTNYNNDDESGNGGNDRRPTSPDSTSPTVTATPPGGSYFSAQSVTLSADEPSTIYYAMDGSDPTSSGLVYSAPIMIAQNTTLKFFAEDTAGNSGTVVSIVYLIGDFGSPNSGSIPFEQAIPNEDPSSLKEMNDATATDAVNNDPTVQNDSYEIPQIMPAGKDTSLGILINEGGNENPWNIGMIIAAILLPAAFVPSIVLHNSRNKAILLDGILIDGSSIKQLFGRPEEDYNLIGRLIDLQYELCWITGLKSKDVKIVLDSSTSLYLGLVNSNHGPSKGNDIGQVLSINGNISTRADTSAYHRKNMSLIICEEYELTLEVIRNELERRIVTDGEKWFVLTGERSYSYNKEKLEQLLSGIPRDEYRNYRMYSLLETLTHLKFILECSGDPKIVITRSGELLFHDRHIRKMRFLSRYGKGRALPRDQWIEDELLRLGTKITEEGSRLMSYEEKHELLISTAIEKYLSAESYEIHQAQDLR
jgi:hypothetical protein